jgi:erythronate-4-phosphate dehydrogenase
MKSTLIIVDSKSPYAEECFRPLGEVRVLPTPEITSTTLRDADAVIVRSETLVGPGLLEGTSIRFVGTATIGTDHIDLPYLAQKEIAFASAPGSNANSVAEYVATGLLVLASHLNLSLSRLTLGVVGVGNVGSRVVRVGESLGMRVLKNDPPLERSSRSAEYVALDRIMDADIVTLHVPLTREGTDPTYHLFDEARIRRMKPGSILVNTSRGAVVETGGMKQALRDTHLRAAFLDVWEKEPAIDTDLLTLAALGSPHIAGYSFDGKVNAARMMFDALRKHLGVEAAWSLGVAMPPPERPVLTIPRGERSEQESLRDVLTACYDIARDDTDLRNMLQLLPDERPGYFRKLRSGYRTRREFAATTVRVPSPQHHLSESLRSLGFCVELT